jgi:cadmium resistance protein CadD (predicted permease)
VGDIAMIGLAALTFVATNIDGAFLLIAFMADPAYRARDVVMGQFLGSTVMTLLCVLVAKAAIATPYAGYFGLLGLLQVVIGVRKLYEGPRGPPGEAVYSPTIGWDGGGNGLRTVALTTVGSFGDNFGVYVPLFATTSVAGIGTCMTVFATMTGLWCLAAHWLVTRRILKRRLQLASSLLLPWLLIVLGISITGRALSGG